MKKHFLRFSIAIFAFICLSTTVFGQRGIYAIKGADVVTGTGSSISNATVVIRDGLIEAVGTNAKIPADAKVLDGKGLTVYPGFIDTYTNLGIKKTTGNSSSSGQNNQSQSNSNYNAVLQAEVKAIDELAAGEPQFKTQRDNGFTTVLTVGSDGIFQGNSAIINLAGDSVSEMIVKPMFGQHITFTTARGGEFPSSLMGTFAALRQMFYDAKRLDEIQKMYQKNPRGMKRPEADATLEALIPVVNGTMPIVFNANTEREIIRVLDLIKEYKLNGIISGGQESYKVVDRLKAQNVPVFLSLNLPVRTLSENKEADPEPLETLRMRVEAPKNAAKLKQAGVKFAFQSDGIKNIKDFIKNAEIATENGLSKSDAIRAMTLSAAELLGIDQQLGSVETGKIANLVVIKGDIFDEDKAITHVFVDGKMFEQPKKPEKKPGDDKPGEAGKVAQVGGTWTITIEPPGQSIDASLVLTQQGNVLTGTLSSALFGSTPINNGLANDKGFSFDATVNAGGTELQVSFSGIVTGNSVEGTVDTPQGPAAFKGTKNP
jgi:imidazolonepropionase-like amidohydrolase